MRRVPLAVTITALLLASGASAPAGVTFYVGPGTGTDPGQGQVVATQMQSAASLPLAVVDFEQYPDGGAVPSIDLGPVSIAVQALDATNNPPPGGTGNPPQVFKGSYGSQPLGTVNGKALLSGTSLPKAFLVGLQFDFSAPVEAFGLWVYDNGVAEGNIFRMVATEGGGGGSATSVWLDAQNGKAHAVEGFLGAVSDSGITKVIIESWKDDKLARSTQPFEVDHLQASVPEAASLIVWSCLAALAVAAGWWRRRLSH